MLGCIRSGVGDEVLIRDSWNVDIRTEGPRRNEFDPNQDGVCPYSSSFSNGRISCTLVTFVCFLFCCLSERVVGAQYQ